MKTVWAWGVMVCIMGFLGGQGIGAQEVRQEIQSLENDFREFKFDLVLKKGRFLLGEPYLTHQDSLLIYQYMLNAAYALGDTALARRIIDEIVTVFPDFQLDPRITSPKIIEFYNYYRKEKLRLQTDQGSGSFQEKESFSPPVVVSPLPVAVGALFPGSGHWLMGQKKRGLVFAGVSAVLLGSALYYTRETRIRENAYLFARQDFDRYYNQYNRAYRIRNALWIQYGIWSLFTMYDLYRSTAAAGAARPTPQAASSRSRIRLIPVSSGFQVGITWSF